MSMPGFRFSLSSAVALLVAWSAIPLAAQSFLGSIGGTVLDSTGAVVPQARVELTETATGVRRTTTSGAEGRYWFPDLPPGTYVVAVSASGFKEVRSSNMLLSAQQAARFDATLEVGATTEVISVSATPPTLNTENAQLGDVRPRQDLLNLPVNTRSTIAFFYLSSFNYQGEGSSYSLGGLRGVNTNFTIDGISTNSSLFGGQVGPMTEAPPESVRDMKILSSNNSAEFPGVGTILISSRGGDNQLHGSAFFVSSNNAFNARNTFSPTKPKGPIRHEFGGSLGGPVLIPKLYNGHNKTFFYFSWEQQRFPGASTGVGNVPTVKMRSGDFSDLLPKTVVNDPTTGTPFPNNTIPNNRISQVSLKVQDFGFLPPNFGGPTDYTANWRGLFPASTYGNRYSIRADHQLSASDNLSARVNLRLTPLPGQYDADLPIFKRNQMRQNRNAYVSENHIFSPRLLNEVRVGFSRDYSRLAGIHNGADLITQFGIQGINLGNKGDLAGVPYFSFVNFSRMYEYPTYFWLAETWELMDNFTVVKGSHNIRTGVLWRYNRPAISEQPTSDFGTFSFDGFASGFDYADFLLGLPHSTGRYERSQPRYNRYSELGLYVQDTWQVSPRMTVNLGLRYEYFTPPIDKNNMRFGFDPSTGNLVVPNQTVLDRLVSPLFPKSIPIVTAQTAGYPERSLLVGDKNNFGPRISIAYRPWAGNRTVLRGGYGLYYSRLADTLLGAFGGGPFRSNESFNNDITNFVPRFQFPNPFPGVGTISTQSISPVSKNLATPIVHQWNFTFEHELTRSVVARITYRGFRGTQIPISSDINKPMPSANIANRNVFNYPRFFAVNLVQDGGIQKLHALDLGVERKFSGGLMFQGGWTWGKNLSDAGNDGEQAGIENPYDRRREMADISWMPRHRFVSLVSYEIPFGTGKRYGAALPGAVRQTLGNWQFNLVTLFQTGNFLNPSFSSPDVSNTRTIGGRPDRVGDWHLADATIAGWFDPKAFAVPPNGRFGNSARNVIVGPGINNWDFGLFKYFAFAETMRLQVRMTATNFFNHPNLGNPNTNISSGSVGRITGLQGGKLDTLGAGARTIQLGLRLDF